MASYCLFYTLYIDRVIVAFCSSSLIKQLGADRMEAIDISSIERYSLIQGHYY